VILGLLATAAAAPRALAQAAPEAGFSEGDKTPEVRRLATQERQQRLRQARIARLRELAAAKGQTERIAALDKLEAKQTQLYNLRLERIRTRLGDQEFKETQTRIRNARVDAARAGKAREVNAREQQQARERRALEERRREKAAKEPERKKDAERKKQTDSRPSPPSHPQEKQG